jgi:hypothetical protein
LSAGQVITYSVNQLANVSANASCYESECNANAKQLLDPVIVGTSPGVSVSLLNSPADAGLGSAPVLLGRSPEVVQAGQVLTLSGIGFGATTGDVVFTAANGATVSAVPLSWSDGAVTVDVPAGLPLGTVSAAVQTFGGTITGSLPVQLGDGTPAPAVTAIAPRTGGAGTRVTLTGSGFAGATAVNFGAHSAQIVSDSPSQMVVLVPAGTGTLDATVVGPHGASAPTVADQFAYPATAYARVGRAGGTVGLPDGATLEVPAGAFRASAIVGLISIPLPTSRQGAQPVRVVIGGRLRRSATLLLPSGGATSLLAIARAGHPPLATDFPQPQLASALIEHAGIYGLRAARRAPRPHNRR